MPPVIIPALIAGGTAAAGAFIAHTAIAAAFWSTFAATLVLGSVNQLLSRRATAPSLDQSQSGSSRTIRQPITSRKDIYGQTKVSGPIVFLFNLNPAPFDLIAPYFAGLSNPSVEDMLYLVIPLADHEVEEIGTIYFNDEALTLNGQGVVTGGTYGNAAIIFKHTGSPNQAADSHLMQADPSQWTANHRLREVAYIVVALRFVPAMYAGGIPNITAIVKGKRVFDPRTSTTYWTKNSALCLADYLSDSYRGLGAHPTNEIDQAALISAANSCDEDVALAGGGTEDRYTCNGIVDSGTRPREVIPGLLSSMAGRAVFAGGFWRIFSGVFQTPTVTLDEDDLSGPMTILPRVSRREIYNAVKGLYVSPTQNYQTTDFPPVLNATYHTEDGGERIFRDIELPFTQSTATSQRIAKIELERGRQQITVKAPFKMNAFQVTAVDVVNITNARMGWIAKPFEVVNWTFSPTVESSGAPGLGVDLVLRETALEVFDWNSGNETTVDPAPDTSLPDPFSGSDLTGLALFDGEAEVLILGDGTAITRIRATWNQIAGTGGGPTGQIEIQWKQSADATFLNSMLIPNDRTTQYIQGLIDGTYYDVRARSINGIGVAGSFAQVSNFLVTGQSEPPPDVPTLFLSGTVLTWTYPNPPADLSGFRVRTNPGSNSFWDSAQQLHGGVITGTTFDFGGIAAGLRTFMVKAVDLAGNESTNSAVLIRDIGDLVQNVVREIKHRDLGWPGVKINGTVQSGDLVANVLSTDSDPFWVPPDNTAFWGGSDADLFWGAAVEEMTYTATFVPEWEDLPGNLTITVTTTAQSWRLEYKAGPDDPFWAGADGDPFWGPDDALLFWGADSTFVAWPGSVALSRQQYELRFISDAVGTSSVLSIFTLVVDAADVQVTFSDFPILSGGTRLAPVTGFRAITIVNLTLQDDGGAAVTLIVIDKNHILGPLVEARDSSSVSTSAVVDAIVRGY